MPSAWVNLRLKRLSLSLCGRSFGLESPGLLLISKRRPRVGQDGVLP